MRLAFGVGEKLAAVMCPGALAFAVAKVVNAAVGRVAWAGGCSSDTCGGLTGVSCGARGTPFPCGGSSCQTAPCSGVSNGIEFQCSITQCLP